MKGNGMNKIVVLSYDDWKGLYSNGNLVYENHELGIEDLITLCPIETIDIIWVNQTGEDYLLENGLFPKKLDNAKDFYD
jgi:hypothetical protein